MRINKAAPAVANGGACELEAGEGQAFSTAPGPSRPVPVTVLTELMHIFPTTGEVALTSTPSSGTLVVLGKRTLDQEDRDRH